MKKIILNKDHETISIDWDKLGNVIATESLQFLLTAGFRGNLWGIYEALQGELTLPRKAFILIFSSTAITIKSLLDDYKDTLKITEKQIRDFPKVFLKEELSSLILQEELFIDLTFFTEDCSKHPIVQVIKSSFNHWLTTNTRDRQVLDTITRKFEQYFIKSLTLTISSNEETSKCYSDLKAEFTLYKTLGLDKHICYEERHKYISDKFNDKIFDESKSTLSDVYISPTYLRVSDNYIGLTPLLIEKFLQSSSKHTLCLVIGNGGQGKSSFCKKLLYEHQKITNIYYIKCRDITYGEFVRNPKDAIYSQLMGNKNYNYPPFPNSILVLDGLDEMADISNSNRIEPALEKLVKQLINNKIIITSRQGYITVNSDYIVNNDLILSVKLQPLDFNQQKQLVSKYSELDQISDDIEKLYQVESPKSKPLYELFGNPLFLSIVLDKKSGIPDASKINIGSNESSYYYNTVVFLDNFFSDLYTILVKKTASPQKDWHRAFGDIKEKDWLHFLKIVAFEINTKSDKRITENNFRKFLESQKIASKTYNFDVQVKLLQLGGYIKQETINEEIFYLFEHDLFREYLAAKRAWELVKSFSTNIEDKRDFLEKLQFLFGQVKFSKETWEYIKALINLDNQSNELNELKILFQSNFKKILNHQGLWEYLANKPKASFPPIDQALDTFYGYWTVLTAMLNSKEFVGKENQEALRNCISLLCSQQRGVINMRNIDWIGLTEISGENLSNLDLTGAKLQGIKFTGCDLRDIILDKANLKNTIFAYCNLSNCRIKDNQFLEETEFENCNLYNSNFSNSLLNKAKFTHCVLSSSVFDSSKLISVKANNCSLKQTSFLNKFFQEECEFDDSNLSGAVFQDGVIRSTAFTESILKNVEFSEEVQLIGINFKGSNLKGSNLKEESINNWVSLEGTILNQELQTASYNNEQIKNLTKGKIFEENEENDLNLEDMKNAEIEDFIKEEIDKAIEKKLKELPFFIELQEKEQAKRKNILIVNKYSEDNRLAEWLEENRFSNSIQKAVIHITDDFIKEHEDNGNSNFSEKIIDYANKYKLILFNDKEGNITQEEMNKIIEIFNGKIPFLYYNTTYKRFNSNLNIEKITYANTETTLKHRLIDALT